MSLTLAYCTVAEFKDAVRIEDTVQDARIEACINASSRAIDGICRRPAGDFLATTATRYYDVEPAEVEVLGHVVRSAPARLVIDPLVTLTTLKTDEDGDGVFEITWTVTTDYLLWPYNTTPKREIRINPSSGSYGFPLGMRRVEIVGSWAESAAVNPLVKEASLLLTGYLLKRPAAPFGVMSGGEFAIRLTSLPKDVVDLLVCAGALKHTWVLV